MMRLLGFLATSEGAGLCSVAQSAGRARLRHFLAGLLTSALAFGLVAATTLGAPANSPTAQISFGVSVNVAPPPLPVYAQPLCPAPGYIWTPGYWAWDPIDGYYWVPGTWVLAPVPGYFWTPGYWGWSEGVYIWNAGYWGPTVGFYGGINYGFGYIGVGYVGGYWSNGAFFYNRAVNNIGSTNITNVYTKTVAVNNTIVNNVSYNGGPGGIEAQRTAAERAAAQQRRLALTTGQRQQQQAARADPAQFVSRNAGKPAVAATPKPGVFSGSGVVQAARAGGTVNPQAYRLMARSATPNPPPGRTSKPAGGTHPLITAHPNAAEPPKTPVPRAETTPQSAAQARSTPPPRAETARRPETKTHTETRHSPPLPPNTAPHPETKRQEEHKTRQARSEPPPRSETRPQPTPKSHTETHSAPAPHKTTPPPETRREEKRKPEPAQ